MKTSEAMSIIEELIDERESSTCTKAWNVICARIGESAPTSTNNARDATAEQTLCSTCYYMVVETSEVPPCRNCRTIRSLWRSAAAPVA